MRDTIDPDEQHSGDFSDGCGEPPTQQEEDDQ